MKIIRSSEMKYIPATHEDTKNPEVWKKILLKRGEIMSGQIQMLNWAKLPKGNTFKAHFHESMEEVFIILSGKVSIRIDDEEVILEAGDTIVIKPKSIHQMSNQSTMDVEYLVIGITQEEGGKTVVV